MSRLATIGYEGATLDDFIATLRTAGVEMLLDVRACAVSRRKGFSKSALSSAVEAAGISYVHLPELGDPKEGREAARAGDYIRFKRVFEKHLSTDEAQSGLKVLRSYVKEAVVCLMCYERSPDSCHRSLVASALRTPKPLRVEHLGVKEGLARNGRRAEQPRKGSYSR